MVSDNNVMVCISKLRAKLEKDGKAGDCKKIFGIMGLGVKKDNEVVITLTARTRTRPAKP